MGFLGKIRRSKLARAVVWPRGPDEGCEFSRAHEIPPGSRDLLGGRCGDRAMKVCTRMSIYVIFGVPGALRPRPCPPLTKGGKCD